MWAGKEDPRVTRIGQSLRSTRFDDLPPLVNVLRGEISLVGPRPERPEVVLEFATRNPVCRAREAAKPGTAGLAQVSGRYDTHLRAKLELDLRCHRRI